MLPCLSYFFWNTFPDQPLCLQMVYLFAPVLSENYHHYVTFFGTVFPLMVVRVREHVCLVDILSMEAGQTAQTYLLND